MSGPHDVVSPVPALSWAGHVPPLRDPWPSSRRVLPGALAHDRCPRANTGRDRRRRPGRAAALPAAVARGDRDRHARAAQPRVLPRPRSRRRARARGRAADRRRRRGSADAARGARPRRHRAALRRARAPDPDDGPDGSRGHGLRSAGAREGSRRAPAGSTEATCASRQRTSSCTTTRRMPRG